MLNKQLMYWLRVQSLVNIRRDQYRSLQSLTWTARAQRWIQWLKLHSFDFLWMCCTTCFSTNQTNKDWAYY